jgi:transcriptional regulator with XRE-family HTH domain
MNMARNRRDAFQNIGGRLKKIRKHLDLSKLEMAGRMGLSYEGYFKNESGVTLPGGATLNALQKNYNISMDWLLFEKGPMLFNDKPSPEQSTRIPGKWSDELDELMSSMENDPQLMHEILVYFYKYKNRKPEIQE